MQNKTYSTRWLQVEITSLCQAGCIDCNRWRPIQGIEDWDYGTDTEWQLNGVHPHMNKYYPLDDWKTHISMFEELRHIQFCGNMGDPMAHPDIVGVLQAVKDVFPDCKLDMSTNGGLGRLEHFKQLAHMGAEISFAMDGLEDTNHIYRRGVDWNKVKTRFQTYIEEGGKAQWQWIEFPHNKHQIDEGRRLAEEWGFDSFDLRQRFTQDDLFDKSIVMASSQPVNLNSQHKENALDKQRLVTDYQEKIEKYKGYTVMPRCLDIPDADWHHPCPQINVDGTLWPCCFTASFPFYISQSTRHWYQQSVSHLPLHWNSLYHHSPSEIMSSEWWQRILPDSWSNGDNAVCLSHCGVCKK